MSNKETKKTNLIIGGVFIVLILSIAGNVLLYKKLDAFKRDPQKQTEAAVRDLVAEVSQYIVLPEGEQPTVATVTDPEKLKEQAFFTKASVGDKVLIYTNAKKAILYSPAQHKIIEVAPINIGSPQQQTNNLTVDNSVQTNEDGVDETPIVPAQ